VFDADYCDGICEHGEHAVVVRMDLVRDVAVDEDVAWTRGSHDAFWDARVRASEPEDLQPPQREMKTNPHEHNVLRKKEGRCLPHGAVVVIIIIGRGTWWEKKKSSGAVIEIESHLGRLALGGLFEEAGFCGVHCLDPLGVRHEELRESGIHLS
jgi:hypothetical protein